MFSFQELEAFRSKIHRREAFFMPDTSRNHFSGPITVFQERRLPERATPAGYAALIDAYDLKVPLPRTLCAIGERHRIVEEVGWRIRHGQQALMVYQNQRVGLLLPFVAVTHNFDREEFVAELIDKAGITRPPYQWCRFDCATWRADAAGIALLEGM